MDNVDNSSVDDLEDEFLSEYKTEFNVVTNFLASIFGCADSGLHYMVATSQEGDSDLLVFRKENDEIYIEEKYAGFPASFIGFLIAGNTGLTVRSFVFQSSLRVESDALDKIFTRKELRGWFLSSEGMAPLRSQHLIEVSCVDAETGKISDPEPNLAYCDAWAFPLSSD